MLGLVLCVGLVAAQGDRLVFQQTELGVEAECRTVGGPAAPLPCQLPFTFGGKLRTTCITGENQKVLWFYSSYKSC